MVVISVAIGSRAKLSRDTARDLPREIYKQIF